MLKALGGGRGLFQVAAFLAVIRAAARQPHAQASLSPLAELYCHRLSRTLPFPPEDNKTQANEDACPPHRKVLLLQEAQLSTTPEQLLKCGR